MLELSQDADHDGGGGNLEMEEEARLQIQQTFSALRQLTGLVLSNVNCLEGMKRPADDVDSLTNLRYKSLLSMEILKGQRCSPLRSYSMR